MTSLKNSSCLSLACNIKLFLSLISCTDDLTLQHVLTSIVHVIDERFHS